jgi:hypothetical protein
MGQPGGYGAPAAAAPYAMASPAPGFAPAYGAPAVGYAPYGAAAAAPPESNARLVFGVAGCAGVLLVLLIVAGAIYFTTEDQSTERTQSGPSSGPTAAPSAGSLRSIVREQVGDYKLVGNSNDIVGGRFREGAVDSIALKYRSASGVDVKHVLIAYESDEAVKDKPELELEVIREQVPASQTFRVTKKPYTNRDGETLGIWYHVELEPEIVMWTNGRVFALVEAPTDHATKFFQAVPY